MARFTYKGIQFADYWTGNTKLTFEQFKAEFEFTAPFRELQSKQRNTELKRVFNIVTKGSPKEDTEIE